MEEDYRSIPIKAAHLIIGYLNNSLTASEKDQLDFWICSSDENMEIFAELTDGQDNAVFDPLRFMAETEEATELWIIMGLIIRHQQQAITTEEQRALDDWTNASPRNKLLFEELQNPAFFQKLLAWACMQRKNASDLN